MASADNRPVIGVDVGGTKVAAAALAGREITFGVEHPTELSGAEELLDGIEKAVREVIEKVGEPSAVGVGVPSQVHFDSGTVVASVNIPLEGIAVREELSGRLGVPVLLDNDGNCAALAEAQYVDGGPASHLVMYTLGTGVGGGIIIDGRIYRGATGLGAELGHVVIQADGPECPGACPNHGCLEAYCSGQALERDAEALARERPDSRLARALESDGGITGKEVVRAAEDGDEDAVELMRKFGVWLGVGLSGALNTFEPQHIVIGGGLSQGHSLFLGAAIEEARSRALPAIVEPVRIDVARAGPGAGVIGAGLLASLEQAGNGDTDRSTGTEGAR
ncbi:MAG: glucokinase [Thermoleophilaceae bacterium]|nr:glucokinase [Thermoleophilaceae bacterium]